jgi:hypothetical protein
MRTSKLWGVVASPVLALMLGAGIGTAAMSDHSGVSQYGKNRNDTTQEARTGAESYQANVADGFSKGDSKDYDKRSKDSDGYRKGSETSQDNSATTKAKSKNKNGTRQGLDQDQSVKTFNFYGRDGYGDCGRCDKDGWEPKKGSNGYDGNGSSSPDVTQQGSNTNSTDQHASSEATTKQANIAGGSGGKGDVDQSNEATTKAKSKNSNWTDQELNQDQSVKSFGKKGHGYKGDGKDKGTNGKAGNGSVSQKGWNSNETNQKAKSSATTKQVNIYAPITVFGKAPSGDVHQSNNADTRSSASNDNWTNQSVDQHQKAYGTGNQHVSQSGGNQNSTDQYARSSATTEQVNIYAPISVYSHGGGSGDVHQDNTATTHSGSANDNGTSQSAGQGQHSANTNK